MCTVVFWKCKIFVGIGKCTELVNASCKCFQVFAYIFVVFFFVFAKGLFETALNITVVRSLRILGIRKIRRRKKLFKINFEEKSQLPSVRALATILLNRPIITEHWNNALFATQLI